jgi:hypothetical protein
MKLKTKQNTISNTKIDNIQKKKQTKKMDYSIICSKNNMQEITKSDTIIKNDNLY